jgi:hypothetical protein
MVVLPVLLLAFTAKADSPRFSNASIQGQYKCTLTSYSLPAKANQPFAATAISDATLAADGYGKFTSGAIDHTIDAPGVHMGCKLTMSTGTYSINPDGTGSETTRWQLIKNDSHPGCVTYFPDSAPASSSEVMITDPTGKMFYTSSINRFAIVATACQK